MAWTEQNLAIAAAKRLQMDGKNLLTLQSFIPNALNNLARKTANDDYQRRYLLSAPASTTASITNTGFKYYADLATLISSPQIMLDYLQYGTIFWQPASTTWLTTDVSGNRISINDHGYQTGMPVLLGSSNTLPAPLVINSVYYIIKISDNVISFATTQANALAGTVIPLTDVGAGVGAATPQTEYVAQWQTPSQALLPPSIPYPYPYIWLSETLLRTNKENGTFAFNVPTIPTLDTLPVALESDLVDAVVQIAVTQGFKPMSAAEAS